MHKLATIPDQSARALEVTVLTLVRTTETRHMRWPQLDREAALWDLGGDATKNARAKRTPLPMQTLTYRSTARRIEAREAESDSSFNQKQKGTR